MRIRDTRNGSWYWVNTAVNACPHITPTDKVVYGALCTFSGYDKIHPSYNVIANRSAVSIRSCKKSIKKLLEVGYLSIEKGGGRGNANIYNLLKVPKGCISCTVSKGCKVSQERVQNLSIKGANPAPHIDNEIDKEKDNIISKQESGLREDYIYTSDFEKFWKEYPKRIGKGGAYKSWNKIKNLPLQEILKAVREQKETKQWKRDEGQYIPHPATWLNQRRWEDEVELTEEQKIWKSNK